MLEQRIVYHNYNLDYQKFDNYENQTSWTLNLIMNDFVKLFKDKFKTHTFIVNYTDDIFGILTYHILKNIQGVYNFNFKLYGRNKKTIGYIPRKFFISLKDKIKTKNIVDINCFNSTLYVKNNRFVFNKKVKGYSPLKSFTPEQLIHLCKFYSLFKKENHRILVDLSGVNLLNDFCNRKGIKSNTIKLNKKYFIPKIKIYELNGDETDFPLYDKILKEEENYIYFYYCPEDKIDFLKVNLNTYIKGRNAAISKWNLNISRKYIESIKIDLAEVRNKIG